MYLSLSLSIYIYIYIYTHKTATQESFGYSAEGGAVGGGCSGRGQYYAIKQYVI